MTDTSDCRSSLYPSFDARYDAAASAPPAAVAESERWPLTASAPMYAPQAPSYHEYYVPPAYEHAPPPQFHDHHPHHRHVDVDCQCSKEPGLLVTTLKLSLFHLLNAVFGVLAFAAVVTSVHFALGLIPLCCVGLLVFRFVVILVRWLAEQDVKLSNYIAWPGEERVVLDTREAEFGGFVGLRLASELSYFSPVSVLGALYFSTVKLVISILSLVVVAIFATLPLMLLAFNDDDTELHGRIKIDHHKYRLEDLRENPFAFYVVWGCLFILSVLALHVVGWLSRAATHFFCTERISEPAYSVPVVQYAGAATTYGTRANV